MWVVRELFVARRPPRVGRGDIWVFWRHSEDFMLARKSERMFAGQGFAVLNIKCAKDVCLLEFGSLCESKRQRMFYDSFEELLFATSARESMYPRDKIFGLLGLASVQIRSQLLPNYSLSVSEVFSQAMAASLESSEDFEFLRVAAAIDFRPDFALPSWCLDFSNKAWVQRLKYLHEHPLMRGPGASDPIPRSLLQLSQNNRHLTIEGTVIGEVNRVVPLIGDADIPHDVGTKDRSAFLKLMSPNAQIFFHNISEASLAAYDVLSFRAGKETATGMLYIGEVWRAAARGMSREDIFLVHWHRNNLPVLRNYFNFNLLARACFKVLPPWAAPVS